MFATKVINTLVAILTLCQTVVAFYPFVPDYVCERNPRCASSKRSTVPAVEGGATTLKLRQRLPDSSEPHAVHVGQLRDRLARKYNRGAPAKEIELRDSAFRTVTAATPTQTMSAGINQDGSDYSYFATVLVGSNNTPLEMLLDTGAGNTWVMGSMCTSKPCTEHSTFGPDDSETYKLVKGQTFEVEYGTGKVKGMLANDTISFAGLKLEMTLGIATETSNDFSSYPMDGILGLSQLKSGNQPNFVETLVAANLLESNVFGVSINRASDGPNEGEINFGAPNPSKYSGSLSYTDVSSNVEADWAIPIDSIGWGGKDSGLTDRVAYLDTGTSFIFCPADEAKAFHALIPGAIERDNATYHVPCSTTQPITITFSGVTYNISSQDWVGPNTNGVCTSNIYGQPVVTEGWLMGDTLLKNVYALFDIDKNRVGLAAKPTPSRSSTPTSSSGGPNSLSDSSSKSPSTSALAPGSPTTVPETDSNGSPTEPGTGTAAPTNSPGFQGTSQVPSSNSQINSAQSSGASAETPSPSDPPKTSGASRLGACLPLVALALLSIIAS